MQHTPIPASISHRPPPAVTTVYARIGRTPPARHGGVSAKPPRRPATSRYARATLLRLACALGVALLAGCAGLQRGAPGLLPQFHPAARAESLEAAGRYLDAAQAYQTLAEHAAPPTREDYLLRAAHAYVMGGQIDAAQALLIRIQIPPGAPLLTVQRQLLTGEIYLAKRNPLKALTATTISPPERLPDSLQRRLRRLRATAFLLAGNPLESVRERVALEPLLKTPEAVQENQQQIWSALGQLTSAALEQLRTAPPPDPVSGWLELATLARAAQGNPAQFQHAVHTWEQRYPDHPAIRVLIPELLRYYAAARLHPHSVALLLPLRGPFAEAASAVLDGFLAAYYQPTSQQTSPPPRIRIYDTGDLPADAVQAYLQAVRDGADFIVGPLRKEAVTAVAQQPSLAVPTLALNYLEPGQPAPKGFYQFGLSPEQEARQVAERAWLDGHSRVLVLAPEGSWGDRVARAFEQRWQTLGGITLGEQRYNPTHTDFATPIRRLLNLDESRARYRALRSLLQRKLEFEPRRRKDVDFIFMAAFPRDARLLRPQLKFHHASDLPVYATSHIYSGTPDADADRDLDGTRFCDMPWTLAETPAQQDIRQELTTLWPDQSARLPRLNALGIDAYRIIPQLDAMRSNPFARFEGATGSLALDPDGRVHRDLLWARFQDGLPVLLDPVAIPKATGKAIP
ncbi:MAG: hypothetical protein B7Z66_01615 [Chromatiales bacterium 21-64-14]|nr:MAG: hypothetical protein B7Z66_01615 [Chromatiales bacterium 21-64-14]